MKNITFISLIFLLFSCNSSKNQFVKTNKPEYAIIPFDSNDKYPIFEKSKPAELNHDEIFYIDSLIKPIISKYVLRHKYFRQYVASENINNEKIVWVNFLCKNHYDSSWENSIIRAADGGDCFIQLKVNLNTNKIFDFRENLDN